MSDDGTRLAVALGDRFSGSSADERLGRISIRDGGTGSEIRRIEIPGVVCDIALTADGSRIAVEYGERRIASRAGEPRGRRESRFGTRPPASWSRRCPCFPGPRATTASCGAPMARGCCGSRSPVKQIDNRPDVYRELFQIVDVASGEELWEREFTNRANPHDAWSWSPDGKLLVIFEVAEPGLAAKHNVQLWDSHTGTTLAILDREAPSDRDFNSNIDFSPDGQRLAVASGANEIYVWEVPKLPLAAGASPLRIAAPHLTLQAAGEEIHGLAFSADGRELHSVDAGASIVTWDATAREDTGLGPDSMEGCFTAAISADATKVAFSTRGTSPHDAVSGISPKTRKYAG